MKPRLALLRCALLLAVGAFSTLALTACDLGMACDLSASASAQVHPVDDTGAPVGVEGVEWRLEGESAFAPADCVGGETPCDTYVAGWEASGGMEIQVVGCPESAVSVTIDQGECHVVTQDVDLAVPVACQIEP